MTRTPVLRETQSTQQSIRRPQSELRAVEAPLQNPHAQEFRAFREPEDYFRSELKRRHDEGIVITEGGRRRAQLTRAHLLGLEDFRRG